VTSQVKSAEIEAGQAIGSQVDRQGQKTGQNEQPMHYLHFGKIKRLSAPRLHCIGSMADDGWDDLFAKAAGKDEESLPKKRQKVEKNRSGKDQSGFRAFLASRMNIPGPDTACPTWAYMGIHMSEKIECEGWEEKHGTELCRNCGTSPLQHRLVANEEFIAKQGGSQLIWPLRMFCSVRNLRCVGVLVIMESKHWAKVARVDTLFSHEEFPLLAPGEAGLLRAKCRMIIHTAEALSQQARKGGAMSKNDKVDMPTPFEEAIRLIIACDDVYYRLYYLQISRIDPMESDASFYVSHPAEYFHIPYLAGSGTGNDSEVKEFLEVVLSKHNKYTTTYDQEKLRDEIVTRYGFDLLQVERRLEHNDALSYLQQNRAMETMRLFFISNWSTTKAAHNQTMKALRVPVSSTGLLRHETAAPPILSEWRDSCRDRLCNLYAYATLKPGTEERIRTHLENAGLSKVIEIGAGTGYLALLLQKAGIQIIAWDVHPTGMDRNTANALNEYHGQTPEFCSIEKGGPSDLRRRFYKAGRNPDVALLLCYPPPESSMAHDALAAYLQVGGTCLVHMGEFEGLTGTSDFEDLLLHHFTCADRLPCLSWGTDAAAVTIWMKNDSEQPGRFPPLLLPCSNCGKVEASKRCRLVRHIAYCGETCFKEHSPVLTVHLAMNMIVMEANSLNFLDDHHFVPIRMPGSKVRKSKT
jgi:hypothetical protein